MSDMTIIRCGGRHAGVIVEILSLQNQLRNVVVWDDNPAGVVPSLKKFESVTELFTCADEVQVFVCHGDGATRVKLAHEARRRFPKATFPNVIHPRAIISPSAKLGVGLFVGPNAIVNANAVVGDFCILYSHDSVVGEGCSINPGAVLCGSVTIGKFVTIGANACVRDHVVVAERCVVGMGAAVTKNAAPASNNDLGFGVVCLADFTLSHRMPV
jgi:acetyltransferase EpsM